MIGTKAQCITYLANIKAENKMYEVKEHKKRRSLNANAYYWSLCGKVAQKTRVSTARIHNMNLRSLGVPERVGGRLVTVTIPDTPDAEDDVLESTTYHLSPTSKTVVNSSEKGFRVYYMLRGSHTFNTEEMSALIDLMVQEAEAQDIETITPVEKQKMMELYGKSYEKKHNTTA